MKLAAEILVAVAVGGLAYYVARPDRVEKTVATKRSSGYDDSLAPRAGVTPPAAHVLPRGKSAAVEDPTKAPVGVADAAEQRTMMTLRNAVIDAASADMQRRGADVAKCFDNLDLIGTQKLRFAVDVASTPRKATARSWRFVEIIDGEPLPPLFASCAAAAYGGGYQMTPPDGFEFPTYTGELLMLYTWPARESSR